MRLDRPTTPNGISLMIKWLGFMGWLRLHRGTAGRTAGQDPRRGNLPIGMSDGLSHAPRPTGRNASPGRGTRTAKTGSTSHVERDPHASLAVGLRRRALIGSRIQANVGQMHRTVGPSFIAARRRRRMSRRRMLARFGGRVGMDSLCGCPAAGQSLCTHSHILFVIHLHSHRLFGPPPSRSSGGSIPMHPRGGSP